MSNLMYNVIIVGAGPGGIFSSYELIKNNPNLKIAVFDSGNTLEKRKCPIDGEKIKQCIHCNSCSIMQGFGGAGAFSDGKYVITNDYGGTLHEKIGKEKCNELMWYVDSINSQYNENISELFNNDNSELQKLCIQNNLHLLNSSIRHLGTDGNYTILKNMFSDLNEKVEFHFNEGVLNIEKCDNYYKIVTKNGEYITKRCIVAVGRSGNKWVKTLCNNLNINTISNRVDIGVRVELPYSVFSHITDKFYEAKIVHKTKKYEDMVRTFCMNPRGKVVTENTNGIITVNGHSFEQEELKTNNTNFALLVSKQFTEPFNDSTKYGESISILSNLLGDGVIVQRLGDLEKGRRTTQSRLDSNFVVPTLKATPGDLSLVLPKRILDDILEMIYALDKIAPGTANPDTLFFGVETKYYNLEIELDNNLESKHKGLYFIGDGSGITHSLSHASASGVYVARNILMGN